MQAAEVCDNAATTSMPLSGKATSDIATKIFTDLNDRSLLSGKKVI